VILAGLQALTPDIPVLSEEAVVSFESVLRGPCYGLSTIGWHQRIYVSGNWLNSASTLLLVSKAPIFMVLFTYTTSEGMSVLLIGKASVGAFQWHGNEFEKLLNFAIRVIRLIVMTSP